MHLSPSKSLIIHITLLLLHCYSFVFLVFSLLFLYFCYYAIISAFNNIMAGNNRKEI